MTVGKLLMKLACLRGYTPSVRRDLWDCVVLLHLAQLDEYTSAVDGIRAVRAASDAELMAAYQFCVDACPSFRRPKLQQASKIHWSGQAR